MAYFDDLQKAFAEQEKAVEAKKAADARAKEATDKATAAATALNEASKNLKDAANNTMKMVGDKVSQATDKAKEIASGAKAKLPDNVSDTKPGVPDVNVTSVQKPFAFNGASDALTDNIENILVSGIPGVGTYDHLNPNA